MNKLRIAVFGYIIRGPIGGLAWHHLHYIKGLEDLGHAVMFFEDSDDYISCYDPTIGQMTTNPETGLSFLSDALNRLGSRSRFGYFDYHTNEWRGTDEITAKEFLRTADLILNISAVNPLRDWSLKVPRRVFIDTDPVFTQVKIVTDEASALRASHHNNFVTFGENTSSVPINLTSFPWKPTRQPVFFPSWQSTTPPPSGAFTTVMQWESYPPVEHDQAYYGLKSDSFEPFMTLPSRVPVELEIALGGSSAPRKELREDGWTLTNPLEVTKTPWTFQDYVISSRAEFTVAKHGYVTSQSGWFSERSANYLAAGRPVVTQETGFSDHIPTGEGLLPFSTLDEAIAAIETVESNYARHCKAAREIAEEYFDSRNVLTKLLDDVMSG